jgi:hypothetical protein
VTQHETAEKNMNFFKITRAYRNAYEVFLEDEKHARDHANTARLLETLQKDDQKDDQNSQKRNVNFNINEDENEQRRIFEQCFCKEIRAFSNYLYTVKIKTSAE